MIIQDLEQIEYRKGMLEKGMKPGAGGGGEQGGRGGRGSTVYAPLRDSLAPRGSLRAQPRERSTTMVIFVLFIIAVLLNLGAALGSFLTGDWEAAMSYLALAIGAAWIYVLFLRLEEAERECEELRRRLDA